VNKKFEFTNQEVKKKQLVILLSVIVFLAFGYIAGNLRWFNDFQVLIDLFAGIFAFFIGTLSLVRFYTKKNSLNYLLFGLGFITVGFIEIYQLLLTFNSFADLFVLHTSDIFPTRIVLSRVFLSLIFFASWFVMIEEYREKVLGEKLAVVAILVVLTMFIVVTSVYSQIFAAYEGYMFAIIMQTIALLIYLITLLGYLRSKGLFFRSFDFWIIFAITFSILSQIFFLPYLNIEYELMINLSSTAKLLSYSILLTGFLHSIYEMYKREEENKKELIKSNLILSETKKKVEEAYMVLRNEKWELTKNKKSADRILKDILKS
jgi:hypothetical protein